MKKGFVVLVLSAIYVLLVLTGLVNATPEFCVADGLWSATECVCGHTPNSSLGYGQVIIGGTNSTIISCNNVLDGICPEDFADMSQVPPVIGNCSSCLDPDCTSGIGYIWGYVMDTDLDPIPNAMVTSHPVAYNISVSLSTNTTTDSSGKYNFSGFIAGRYYFSASKIGYDTSLIEHTVVRDTIREINFTLQNGTCHEDCTNSYNRCNAACDGVVFANSSNSCNFYNSTVRTLCNNKLQGIEVYLGPANGSYSWFVSCCEGIPYQKYYPSALMESSGIKNLIKTEKISRHNDVPVRIVVAYW